MSSPRVGVIVLNWNGEEDTCECLTSLREVKYPNFEVLVVDNASSKGSPDRIKSEFPEITLIKNKSNLGFAEGNNVGIEFFRARGVDYFLLLNNDTVVEPDFLGKLVSTAEEKNQYGIFGPKIYYYDPSDTIWFAGGFISRLTGKPYHAGLGNVDRGEFDEVKDVVFVTGCALFFRKIVVEKIKGLDPDYFVSHEDVDFCLRAAGAGFPSLYVPSSRIKHKFARSAGGRFSPLYIYYRVRNSLLLLKKNNFPFYTRFIALFLNPLKMIVYTMFTLNFCGARAALSGFFDFMRGKFGKGPY